jgi:hypothetical protein
LWVGRPYTEVGFGILTFFLFTAATAAMSMLCTTLHMDAKNQQWWWNSWASGASSWVFFFLFSLYYLMTALHIRSPTGIILYLGSMAVISAMLALYGGAVGFLSSWGLVCKMYSPSRGKDFQVMYNSVDEHHEPLPCVVLEEHLEPVSSPSPDFPCDAFSKLLSTLVCFIILDLWLLALGLSVAILCLSSET